MTDPTPLDPTTLAAIRSRDDGRMWTYGGWWGNADRRALLAEVDRLVETLAAAEAALAAERAKVARVEGVVTGRPWLGDSGRRNRCVGDRGNAQRQAPA